MPSGYGVADTILGRTGFGKTDPDGYGYKMVNGTLYQKSGAGIAGYPGLAVKEKSGYATAGGVGAAVADTILGRTGYSSVGGVGAGPSASVFVEAGVGKAAGSAAGLPDSIFAKTGKAGGATSGQSTAQNPQGQPIGALLANSKIAQSFSYDKPFRIRDLRLWLAKQGSPTDGVVIDIQSDSGGNPSGTVLGTDTISAIPISSTPSWISLASGSIFNLSLSANTTYWIVASRTSSTNGSNYIYWTDDSSLLFVNNDVVLYPYGIEKQYNETSWSPYPTPHVLLFELDVIPPSVLGSGPSESIFVESGSASVGGVGAGVSSTDEFSSGVGIAGLVGAGADVLLLNETGYATVGGIGSGASSFTSGAGATYTKAGYSTVGCVGAGPSASIFVETGPSLVSGDILLDDFNRSDGSIGSNWSQLPSAFISPLPEIAGNKAAVSTAGTETAAYWNVTSYPAAQELKFKLYSANAGYHLYVFLNVTLSDSLYLIDFDITATNTFSVTVYRRNTGSFSTVGSSGATFVNVDGDEWTVGHDGAGSIYINQNGTFIDDVNDSTPLTSGGYLGWGGRNANNLRIDDFKTTGVTSTGFGIGAIGSGTATKARETVKTGFGAVGTIGAGDAESTVNRSGFATVGGVGAGVSSSDEFSSGVGIAGTVGAGTSASVFVESGFASAGTVGAATADTILNKTGFGTVGGVGSGASQRAGVQVKSGYGVAGTVGAGPGDSISIETGFGNAGTVGAGPSESVFVESGYGTVGGVGSGASEKVTPGGTTYTKAGYGVIKAGSLGSVILLDDFNRADSASLGSNWSAFSLIAPSPAIVSNKAQVAPSGNESTRYWNVQQYPANQGLGFTLAAGDTTGHIYGWLEIDSVSADNLYIIDFDFQAATIKIFRRASASYTELTPSGTLSWTVGDLFTIYKSGADLTVRRNGNVVLAVTDSSPLTGPGYIGFGGRDNANLQIDDFSVFALQPGAKQVDHIRSGYGTVGTVGAGSSARDAAVYTKSGYAVAGTVGAGPSASIFVDSGSGIAGIPGLRNQHSGYAIAGLVGAGARAIVHVEPPQDAIVLICANAVAETLTTGTYTKSGYAVAGVNGYGPSASIDVEAGRGVAGTVGAGPSASIFVESGYATVGTVATGSNESATLFTKAGYATAGVDGHGADAYVDVESGYATVGTVGAGVKVFISGITYTKSGYAVAGTVGKGPSASIFDETGYAVAGTVGTGPSRSIFVEAGYAVVDAVGSGASSRLGVHTKTGRGVTGLIGAGPSESEFTKSGFAKVGTTASGPSASEYNKSGYADVAGVAKGSRGRVLVRTGYGASGATGAGTRSRDIIRRGRAVVGTVGSGVKNVVVERKNYGTVGLRAFGFADRLNESTKTGFASLRAVGFGTSRSVNAETGFATAGTTAVGVKSVTHIRRGSGAASGVGTGERAVEHYRTGRATVGTTASGTRQRELEHSGAGVTGLIGKGGSASFYTKAGYAAVGVTAASTSGRISIKFGYATVSVIGSGGKSTTFQKFGYSVVGSDGYGLSASVFIESGFGVVNTVAFAVHGAVTLEIIAPSVTLHDSQSSSVTLLDDAVLSTVGVP